MSITIGQAATDALIALRGNKDFVTVLDELYRIASDKTQVALETDVGNRVDATGYARGLGELWRSIESQYRGVKLPQVPKPRLPRASSAAPEGNPS